MKMETTRKGKDRSMEWAIDTIYRLDVTKLAVYRYSSQHNRCEGFNALYWWLSCWLSQQLPSGNEPSIQLATPGVEPTLSHRLNAPPIFGSHCWSSLQQLWGHRRTKYGGVSLSPECSLEMKGWTQGWDSMPWVEDRIRDPGNRGIHQYEMSWIRPGGSIQEPFISIGIWWMPLIRSFPHDIGIATQFPVNLECVVLMVFHVPRGL